MPVQLRSAALRNLARPFMDDGVLSRDEARALLEAARAAGPSSAVRADIGALAAHFGPQLGNAERDALLAFAAGRPPPPGATDARTARASRVVGPESPAKPGDLVRADPINWTPGEITRALKDLAGRVAQDPDLKARIVAQPWPRDDAGRLEWALAYELKDNKLEDPLWHTATNDNSAAATSYVHGVVAAHRAGHDLAKIEDRVGRAEQAFLAKLGADPDLHNQIAQMPWPTSGKAAQLEWAVAQQFAWTPEHNADYVNVPDARALADLVRGVFSKRANNNDQVPVLSERKLLTVDGDERIYAVHTPKGPKPAGGWPTVLFFHGSYGGHAPEQTAAYQALNAIAEQQGFQVLYPVGAPQDRNDAKTGRGMLNWDPVGAGPGGRNDRFVHELLKKMINDGDVDKSRVIVSGHSQGGYYVSDLLAAYPDLFAGAAVFGAGGGSVFGQLGPRGTRRTPTYMFVGQDDIHLNSGDQLAAGLRAGGYQGALTYDRPAGRGHEILPQDFARMFQVLGDERHPSSALGTTDGTRPTGVDGGAQPGPVFRDFIDVNNPPPEVQQQPWAWNLLAQLAQNPWLQLDANPARVSVDEWKQALRYLHTWPPAMQQQIAALRAFFVVAAPPQGALDLSNTASPIWADRDMARAAYLLQAEPAFDLDGYPGLISRAEVDAALQLRGQLQPDQVRGLEKLRAHFTPTTGVGPRQVTMTPEGARLEVYPGSDRAKANMERLLAGLAKSPAFAKVIAGTTVLVSPPGLGLEAIPEVGPPYANAEGVAMFDGPDGHSGPPTFVIREDSISRWDLGAAHELLHLLLHSLGPAAFQEAEQIREAIRLPNSERDDYANPHEMFSFFGQWYLAGHGDVIEQLDKPLFDFLKKHLGDARVQDPGWGDDGARASITSLFRWFQTGRPQNAG